MKWLKAARPISGTGGFLVLVHAANRVQSLVRAATSAHAAQARSL